ncbi:ABC transporter permease [Staphylococcus sp. SQ8-PEA]|uniref:ABC transporter permease n=1 Tax=Staphylococcus marylandisciuri TaxID=2981529 RepID=A0ABT2QS55_9STAP|nr:ABC transporter permease [Staphylococcus marylandisciuri]MCU5746809.1 ABC transporter permease [Staphylococcus marylandisciuri]
MSNQAIHLFKQRRIKIAKEKRYYNKFIFNGHFTVFLVLLLGAFILGYGQWLKSIPKGINYSLITSVIFALTSMFPMRTLLQNADRLFLLPFEKNMKDYIKCSLIYSYFQRVMRQIALLIIFFPLFFQINHHHYAFYILFTILALVLPFTGLILKWQWYKYDLEHWSIHLILFIIFTAGYYITLDTSQLTGLASIGIVLAISFFVGLANRQHLFPWERMIDIETQHRTNYYKFVNMFTDVKDLSEAAVRRRYLDPVLRVPKASHFNENYMYLFLFKRSFVRGKDAFNIILRLILIAGILMTWLHQPIVSLIIGCLFTYVILLQMSQFYTQQAYGLWPQVWPVDDSKVIKGYQQFLYRLLLIIALVFIVIYALVNPLYMYAGLLFILVGWLTILNIIKKLKYQESLLKD